MTEEPAEQYNLLSQWQHVADVLRTRYRLSKMHRHRGTKGDIVEDALTHYLSAVAPDSVRLQKAEVTEAEGRRSAQFDIVVSVPSTAVRPFSAPNFPVVPVEDVLHVVEIKSILQRSHLQKFRSDLDNIGSFRRYFVSTEILKFTRRATNSHPLDPFTGHFVLGRDAQLRVAPISGGVVAFEGPKEKDTVEAWLKDLGDDLRFFYVCLFDRGIYTRDESSNWRLSHPEGVEKPDALAYPFLVSILLEIMKDAGERTTWVACDSQKYVDFAARQLDRGSNTTRSQDHNSEQTDAKRS